MTVREVKSGKPKCGIGFSMIELRPKLEHRSKRLVISNDIKKNSPSILNEKKFFYRFHVPVETSVGITEEESINQFVYLDPGIAKSECQHVKLRDDNYFEVELDDYFHIDGETRDLGMTVREVKSGKPKCGIGFSMIEVLLFPNNLNKNYRRKVEHNFGSFSILRTVLL
ncbi:hypothetical protein AgCh_034859 [Apium graveolens]